MQGNLFNDIKDRVRMPELMRYYGIEINRSGMCSCPFHDEKTASAKVYENSLHCFGCGEHQDAIGFVAKYFNLSQIEAAKKINADFYLGLEVDKPINKAEASAYMKKREQEAAQRKAYEKWEADVSGMLSEMNKTLLFWQNTYAPKTPAEMEMTDERYLYAMNNANAIENMALDFLNASKEDRHKMSETSEFKDSITRQFNEIKDIEKRFEEPHEEINDEIDIKEDPVISDNVQEVNNESIAITAEKENADSAAAGIEEYDVDNDSDLINDTGESILSESIEPNSKVDRKEDVELPVKDNNVVLPSAEQVAELYKKLQRNESENSVYKNQLDKFFKGEMPSNEVFSVCATPNILKILQSNARKVVLNQADLKNAIADRHGSSKQHTEAHEIGKDEMYKLADEIRNPIMVLRGNKNNPNSVVLITDIRNKEGSRVLVPIALDRQNGKVNRITSIYGKENIASYLANYHLADILAVNTKKADKLYADIGFQLPKSIMDTVIRYDDSIAYSAANVKYPNEKNFEQTQFFETSAHGKVLPVLNAKVKYHESRLDLLLSKRATQEQKVEKNQLKLDKLTDKAARLEDISKALSSIGSTSTIQNMLKQIEQKTTEIRLNKIPAREAKIIEHKKRIAEIDHKSAVIGHKLERAAALSDVIKSFGIIGAEGRVFFADSIDRLNRSTIDCLKDKQGSLSARLSEKEAVYCDEKTTTSEKLDLQQDITKLRTRINMLNDKIDKISVKEAYTNLTNEQLDEEIQNAEAAVDNSVEQGEISIPEISEALCGNTVADMVERRRSYIENEKNNYLENAEKSVESNYNNIDGIINNGAEAQEIPGTYDEIERATDQQRIEAGNTETNSGQSRNWLKEMLDSGKAELNKDGSFKINEQYFMEMDRSERQTFLFSRSDSQQLMKELAESGVAFSAVSRGSDKTAITVSKNDLRDLSDVSAELSVRPINRTERSKTENQRYYNELPRSERSTFTASKLSSEQIKTELDRQGIEYAAAENKNGIKFTVSRSDADAAKDICKNVMYVNPEYYAAIPSKDRFTQRMDEATAREVAKGLKADGIEHSAVFKGDKSGVTINQRDYKRVRPPLKKILERKAQQINQQSRPPKKNVNRNNDVRR